jgi:hypothetical protein
MIEVFRQLPLFKKMYTTETSLTFSLEMWKGELALKLM